MNIHSINVIAHYEVKLLKRSWLFRVFAILVLLILTLAQLINLSPVFWKYNEIWRYVGVSSLIPFFTVYLYNIAQSVIVIFLAGSFLKRDKKLDTAEVIYVRPMSNADYIIGKVWGITRVFIGLNIIVLLVGMFINLVLSQSPFSIIPYLFYLFTISLPSLWFVLGLSFTMMCLLKNQAVTFIVMLGIVGTIFFYLKENLYGVFDFFGVNIPAIFSDVTGHPDIALFLLQRFIYLLLGISFICFTITLVKRLPHRPWKTAVIDIIAFILLLVGIGLGALYLSHFRSLSEVRSEFVEVFNKYAEIPKVHVVSNDIDLQRQGRRIEVESRMILKNNRQSAITPVILYLNPALEVVSLESGEEKLTYRRDRQVIEIDATVQPGAEMPLLIKYAGTVDENICYTDVEDKEFLANPPGNSFGFRYGKKYVFLDDVYTLLTPECLWYPVTESPVYPAVPYQIKKDFTRYTLAVSHPENQTSVSQGKRVQKEGKTFFVNDIDLPGISLTIGDYEKKAVTVDSTDYELYYFRGHDFFSKYFNEIQDTLPAIIREIRVDLEVNKNRNYPFPKFVLAETPLAFTGYIRNWKGYTEHVMPEIVFIPERGVKTMADFRAAGWRILEWTREKPEENEKQIRIFKDYIQSTLVGENSTDGTTGWGDSPAVNQLNFGAMFFGFTGSVYSADYPIMDVVLNTMQNTNESSQRRWFFSMSIADDQRANIYLQDHSFKTALSDKTIKPRILYEILKLKSNYLRNYITSRMSVKEFNTFMKQFNEAHPFTEVPFEEFLRLFKEQSGFDLLSLIQPWYVTDHSAGFTLKDVDANKVVVDDFTKYLIRLKVYNRSDVDGIITMKVEGGGPGGGRMRMNQGNAEDNLSHYIIPAKSAWEIKLINDERPGQVVVNTNISNNLPNEFTFNFSKVDSEITDTIAGIFPVDTLLFALDPREIIIDNTDAGFRTIEGNTRHKLKDLFRKEEEEKYQYFFPWRIPSRWTTILNNTCYGLAVNSAVYKSKGKGNNKVQWTAQIPKDNYYEIFVWSPKFDSWGWGRRNHGHIERSQTYTVTSDKEVETVTMDLGQEENTWVSLGSFYLSAGEVTLTLSDKVSGDYVVADAVKFTLIDSE